MVTKTKEKAKVVIGFFTQFLRSSLGNMWTKWTTEGSWAVMRCYTSVEAAGWCHCKVIVSKFWAVLVTAQILKGGRGSFLCTWHWWDTSGVLGAVLGYPVQGRYECSGVSPVKGCGDGGVEPDKWGGSCDCSSWSWRIFRADMMWYLKEGAKDEKQILLSGIQ